MRQTGKCQQWSANMIQKQQWCETAVPFGPLLFARFSSSPPLDAALGSGYKHTGVFLPNPFFLLHFYYLYSIKLSFRSSVWQNCWPAHCFGKLSVHNRAPSVTERFHIKQNWHISVPSLRHFGCFPKPKCLTFEIQHLTMMSKLLQANAMTDYGRFSKFRLDNLR